MRKNTGIWVAVGVIVGLGAAVLTARILLEPAAPDGDGVAAESPHAPSPEDGSGETDAIDATPRTTSPLETAPYLGEVTRPVPTGEMFSPALLDHFHREFRVGWDQHRDRPPTAEELRAAEESFRERVLAMPTGIGVRCAQEANQRDAMDEARKNADGNALLAAAGQGHWEPTVEELDSELLDELFASRSQSATIDGALFRGDWKRFLEDGITLRFGAGFHELDARQLRGRRGDPFPADVTIEGAGINATMLTIGNISTRSDIRRLRVRDLTLDCGNNYFFDLRGPTMTLDLVRVRIVRFDMGAGGSLCFSSNGGALIRARHCEILGGYGRSPGSGNLWRGGAFIAHFSDCLFRRLSLELQYLRKESMALFDRCTFLRMSRDPTQRTRPGAVFRACQVEEILASQDYRKSETRSLSELFPDWEGR